jgi:predicted dehydrogenase
MSTNNESKTRRSRRDFLRKAALSGAAACGGLSLSRGAHAAGSDVIKVGLIGCGGRGSGAAANAMNAGKDIRLVAMADVFAERIEASRPQLKKLYPDQMAVDDTHCFIGFDAYQKVIQSGVDAVIVAGTSHFHPMHLKAAVDAGKHVFCEKPHGIDVPGAKLVAAACQEAKKKSLCVVSGLCWRYDYGVRETMKRIHDGQIGQIVAIQANRVHGPYILRERKPEWNEMQFQLQNWYHFDWLSGNDPSQTLIHQIDKGAWALGDVTPTKAWALGGRQVCVEPKFGDQFDHQAIVYEYPSGVRMFAYCRHIPGCYGAADIVVMGTKGRAFMPSNPHIEGEKPWRFKGHPPVMTDVEHKEMFEAIRAGKTINNGHYMFTTSMLAVLGQMAAYTGQEITWQRALTSKQSFMLPRYAWDVEPPVKPGPDGQYPTAMPGITTFR